jgi:hypothetical protein
MSETLPAVQILPMNRNIDPELKVFRDVSELQEKFFLHKLPQREGKYYYRNRGLRKKLDMVVLFQSDKKIIASATLLDTEEFKKPKKDKGVSYKGALHFNVESIRVFDPIPWEVVSRIWPKAKNPGRAKFKLEPSGYAAFEEELENVLFADAATPSANDTDGLPEKEKYTAYRFIRDTKTSRQIKALYGNRCQICGVCLQLPRGKFYAEAHHLKPLGGKHKGPDRKDNILCLCPNHHALFDYFAISLHQTKLHSKKHALNQSFVDYHNAHVRSACSL